MEYTELTDAQRSGLVRDRILQLEGEHFRLEILVHEATSADEAARLVASQAEIVRRVELHRGMAALTESEIQSEIATLAATADAMEGAAERP